MPITDEQAPLATSIDDLIDITYARSQDYFVFNCQIGRGRTTTGMIICSMALTFKRGKWGSLLSTMRNERSERNERNERSEQNSSSLNSSFSSLNPGLLRSESFIKKPDSKQMELSQGFYPCVIELLGMMKGGSRAKQKLDLIIDSSSDMQNIREVIYQYHVREFVNCDF